MRNFLNLCKHIYRNLLENAVVKKQMGFKKMFFGVVLCLFIIFTFTAFAKYILFETVTDVALLRNSIGKIVCFRNSDDALIIGELKECRYVFDDKIGFFSLRIYIQGSELTFHNSMTNTVYSSISKNFAVNEVGRINIWPCVVVQECPCPASVRNPENEDSEAETDLKPQEDGDSVEAETE